MEKSIYFVYILACADSTFYTGITSDITRRLEEHNHSDKGAKYTKNRRPVTLVYSESCPDKSEALKREIKIKKLSRIQKEFLVQSQPK
jgi:putative endonuclease